MPAKRVYGVEAYETGLKLLAIRKRAKHGGWLRALREMKLSQPTAWRRMRFAEDIKAEKSPFAANLRGRLRDLRAIRRTRRSTAHCRSRSSRLRWKGSPRRRGTGAKMDLMKHYNVECGVCEWRGEPRHGGQS